MFGFGAMRFNMPRWLGGAVLTPAETVLSIINGKANCAFIDFKAATSTTNYVAPDQSNNGNDYVQTVSWQKPTPNATLGLVSTTGQQNAIPTRSGALSTMIFPITKDEADEQGWFTQESSDGKQYSNDVGTALAGVEIDGSPRTTLNAAHDVLDDGAQHIVILRNVASPTMGRNSAGFLGSVPKLVMYDQAQVTGADVATLEAAAVLAVAA